MPVTLDLVSFLVVLSGPLETPVLLAGVSDKVAVDDVGDPSLERADCFFGGLALGDFATQVGGIFNTVSPVGHTTMGELLDAALQTTKSTAELVWLTPQQIAEAEIAPWSELPIWVPRDGPLAGLHNCDVTAAIEAGLHCRPIIETVNDTWSWLQAEGTPEQHNDRPTHGLDPQREATIIHQHT